MLKVDFTPFLSLVPFFVKSFIHIKYVVLKRTFRGGLKKRCFNDSNCPFAFIDSIKISLFPPCQRFLDCQTTFWGTSSTVGLPLCSPFLYHNDRIR